MDDYFKGNPYYAPESIGLTTVGEVELAEPCYSFDLFVVWQSVNEPEKFYWGQDSGCSCPSPFDSISNPEDLESGSKHDAISALYDATEDNTYAREQRITLVDRLAQL